MEGRSFVMRERKGVELHGRGARKELGKLEGGELELGYIVWEKNVFNKGDIFEKKEKNTKISIDSCAHRKSC